VSTHPTDFAQKPSSNHLNRQIGQYSLAAAVAGVSVLALAAPVAGEVVVTKKTIQIPVSSSDMPHPVRISMANNGVNNFSFSLASFPANGSTYPLRDLIVYGASSNANPEVACCSLHAYAPALQRGARIGPSAGTVGFGGGYANIERTYAGPIVRGLRGSWGGNPKDRYVGVRFWISGKTHYGWIRLTVKTSTDPHGPRLTATITGYAYETVANKPILAGTAATESTTSAEVASKPTAQVITPKNLVPTNFQNQAGPSLGMLAAGSDAMPLWRREETSVRQ
jgi:hypothetical protein